MSHEWIDCTWRFRQILADTELFGPHRNWKLVVAAHQVGCQRVDLRLRFNQYWTSRSRTNHSICERDTGSKCFDVASYDCLAPICRRTDIRHESQHATAIIKTLAAGIRGIRTLSLKSLRPAHGSQSVLRKLCVAQSFAHGKPPIGYARSGRRKRHSRMLGLNRRERAQYGLRACRIGEVRHPGPLNVAKKFHKGCNLATGSALVVLDEPMTPGGDDGHLLAAGPATAAPPLPPPPSPPDTPVGGRGTAETSPQPAFPCFMCNRSFGNQERFMLVHACRVHAGDIITPSAQARLTASGRGVCGTENCDACASTLKLTAGSANSTHR